MPVQLAIFASGAGSNAQKIIDHFKGNDQIKIALIVCNNPEAGVLKIAEKENISSLLIKKQHFNITGYKKEIKTYDIEFIVLAGFLWKIPSVLIETFPRKIINIHPALLPKYGGKGMYGHFVHEAVIKNKEQESGISIHYIDEHYDHGDIIFQAKCCITDNDNPDSLAQKVHVLEHRYFPEIIEKTVLAGITYDL